MFGCWRGHFGFGKAEKGYEEEMERKINLDSAVKWWRPAYQHNSVFSSLGRKDSGRKASNSSSKTSSRATSRKKEALA